MISDLSIDQAYSDLRSSCGGIREDYFGLLYLEKEFFLPRKIAINQIAFGGNDYGVDGFYFDKDRKNLYILQFKYSNSHSQFRGTFRRLIDKGVDRIFHTQNHDEKKNQVLQQLSICLRENKSDIDQICFRFVFTGDAQEAERSNLLDKLREDLESKKFYADEYFSRTIGFLIEYRSTAEKVGKSHPPTTFPVRLEKSICAEGPNGEKMLIGFVRLADLDAIYQSLAFSFFDRNIRYGLGEEKAVNRSIKGTLKSIVLEQTVLPECFVFDHNGITLFAGQVVSDGDTLLLSSPRLLNGAQTVSTVREFLNSNKDNIKLARGREKFNAVRVICKVITNASDKFVTRVTINNNRQNPVEPWTLHANDEIQLALQDKFRADTGIYYERQEHAFVDLTYEALEDRGITEVSKAVQMLKLTQTFLLSDGHISRLAEIRRVFEDEKIYDDTFRQGRLNANTRQMVLCYKVQFRLRKLTEVIQAKGQSKYHFVSRARLLLWALMCQAILNYDKLDAFSRDFGVYLTLPTGYTDVLNKLAAKPVRIILLDLVEDAEYLERVAEDNLSFLRTDRAFDKCMEIAFTKWGWTQKKLA